MPTTGGSVTINAKQKAGVIQPSRASVMAPDGTTTDSYVSIMDWRCAGFKDKHFKLKNTDGSNGLKYKLLSYMHEQGQVADTEVAETTLAAGNIADFAYTKPYHRLVLQVKAASAGSQATYSIEGQAITI